MKKFNLALVLFVIATAFMAFPALAADIHVKGKVARVRSGPGTNYSILWESMRYTPFEYLAKFHEWYAVRDFEGDVGWVHEQVIGKGKGAIVTTKRANIRKGPGPRNEKVFTVTRGYVFKIVDKKGEWYKVQDVDGLKGWVHEKLVWVSR